MSKLSVNQAFSKANSLTKKGKISDARKIYEQILLNFPGNKRARTKLKSLKHVDKFAIKEHSPSQKIVDDLLKLYNHGRLAEIINQAHSLKIEYPNSLVIWNILGGAYLSLGHSADAIQAFIKVTELNPSYSPGYNNLGSALKQHGNYTQAEEAYEKAISLNPKYAEAYNNLGIIKRINGDLSQAIDLYLKAINIKSDFAGAYNNLGYTLRFKGKLEESLFCIEKAISIDDKNADFFNNMGITLKHLNKFSDAINAFNIAITLSNNFADAYLNRSYILLHTGKLKQGLNDYEWRWKASKFGLTKRVFSRPILNRKNLLSEKTIMLWSEQGPCDVIIWLSSLKYLIPNVKHCIIECPEKLVSLLQRSFPEVTVRVENKDLTKEPADFDFHLPLGSLFRQLLPEISNQTNVESFLTPKASRIQYWKGRLEALGSGLYVGISWKSPVMKPERSPNYTELKDWNQIFSLPNLIFINLDSKDFENDLIQIESELGIKIHNFNDLDHYDNLDDVAALCAALNLCISVNTAVASIAAAVGTDTKLLTWRQSPWNNQLLSPAGPNVTIYERDTWEPWDKCFEKIAKSIEVRKKQPI